MTPVSVSIRKAIAAKGVQDLGVQVIDGRRLRAYRVEYPADDKSGNVATRLTYWIDAKRDLLVRTEFVGPTYNFLVTITNAIGATITSAVTLPCV